MLLSAVLFYNIFLVFKTKRARKEKRAEKEEKAENEKMSGKRCKRNYINKKFLTCLQFTFVVHNKEIEEFDSRSSIKKGLDN